MSNRKGSISVNTSDILPIIKKWLYSEHDIFLRELVSNACDAITKRSTLGRIQNVEIPVGEVTVEIDKPNKIIRIHDNGLGMTEEEVEKYLAKLAFSGAEEFVSKMKEQGADQKEDIIGKFGLGFYSVFMVANRVEVDTLSMTEGSKAVKWVSEGETEYTFEDSERETVGTTITAFVNDESLEFLDNYKTKNILKRYCDFMQYPIYVNDIEEEQKKAEQKKKEEESKTEDDKNKNIEEAQVEEKVQAINETKPLWKKDPVSLKDEDYLNFYRSQFPMDPDPLFWIHLKVDHPFELLGVLYFPKLNPNKPVNEQNIRLYAKQVFVSDNVKDIIPDFLGLLKGHIDSSDIPLNVSRSSLQGDPNIKKISNYIIKKVAESLKKLFKNNREKYEQIWEDIGLFVKYGCVSDEKFDEQMRDFVIFKNSEDKYFTLNEYKESIPADYQEKMKNKVLYSEKGNSNNFLRRQLLDEGIHSIETDNVIDPHFIQHIEMKSAGDDAVKFSSTSAEIENILQTGNTSDSDVKIQELFKSFLAKEEKKDSESADSNGEEKKEAANPFDNKLDIEIKSFKNSGSPAYLKIDEQMKRFQHMTRTMGNSAMQMPLKKTLVINPSNPLVQNALKIWEKGENNELVEKLCLHIHDLANLSSDGLQSPEEKEQFISRSEQLIQELTGQLSK